MPTYASSVLDGLALQLKRGPKRLRLRQLLNIEFLLSVIESEKSYPYEFIVHTITGYRAQAAALNGRASEMIEGDELAADLSLLAEDLSEDADIRVENWTEPVYSVTELSKRFDVSTKTIFRWRRRGLVGWKFRFADRRLRMLFPERSVRRFVAQNIDLVHRGSSFSQLKPHERAAIISRATGLVDGESRTVNSVARVIAAETGRAVETIRLILKHHDDAHPKAGIFNRSKLQVSADDQRLAVWEAYVDGAKIDALAERFGRPVAWIYKTVTQMRARDLKARKIDFIPSADFDAPDADAILRDENALSPHAEVAQPIRIPAELPPYLRQLFLHPLLTAAGEKALFKKMNFLRHKAAGLRDEMDPDNVRPAALDRIEALLDEAAAVKNTITQANLRLVVSIAKRHIGATGDLFELISDGNISLMRAIDKFDYTRGFKFSTYGSWAIMKNFARTIPEEKKQLDRYQTGREEFLESAVGISTDDAEDEQTVALRGALDRMLSTLDPRERTILRERFGLDGGGEARTLEQIGQQFGVSKERIRQLEARAMARLRATFDSDARQLLTV